MTPEIATDLIGESLHLTMLLVLVLVLPGLIMGLLVALFQAATQINEQTLAFLPRLMVTLLVLGVAGRWMVALLMDFCVSIFERAAQLVS
ncbi:flagellar biosynthetic protein FliQ [Roseateles sp.]|uniref:flagellar biosynthetic protein FliQ n=1 Tax=Roseateles sp. TaxID=1971397 RepID=UPI0031DAAEF7